MISGVFDFLSNVIFQTCYVGSDGNFPKPLDKQTESELLDKIAEGDIDARDKLIKHNMRLVIHVVKKYNNYYDTDELISVGSLGLIKAVKTYSKGKGTGLATYAARCIENEILMHLRKVVKTRNELSLDEPLNVDWEGNVLLLSDVLGTERDVIYKDVENDVEREILIASFNKLPPRERQIVKLRFGILGSPKKTQKEIADMFGISQSYISRLEKKVMKKLKKEMSKMV